MPAPASASPFFAFAKVLFSSARLPGVAGACRLLAAFLLLGGVSLRASPRIYVDKSLATEGTADGTTPETAFRDLSQALAVAAARHPTAADPAEIWVATGVYKPSTAGLANPREATFTLPSYTELRGIQKGDDPYVPVILSGDIGVEVNGGIPTELNRNFAGHEDEGVDKWRPDLPGDEGEDDAGDPGFADNVYNVVTAPGYGSVLRNVVVVGGNAGYVEPAAGQTGDVIGGEDIVGMTLMKSGVIPAQPQVPLDRRVAGGGVFVYKPAPATQDEEEAEFGPRQTLALRIQNCYIVGNFARLGGGVAAGHCTVSFVNVAVQNNRAEFDGGGFFGLDVAAGAQDCRFAFNVADGVGGGVSLVGLGNKRALHPTQTAKAYKKELKELGLTLEDVAKQNELELFTVKMVWLMNKYAMLETLAGRDPTDLSAKIQSTKASLGKTVDFLRGKSKSTGPVTAGDVAGGCYTAYEVFATAVMFTDWGLRIASAVDEDLEENDPVYQGFRTFVDGFNKWATPEGLIGQAVEQFAMAVANPKNDRSTGVAYRRFYTEHMANVADSVDFLRCEFEGNQAVTGAGVSAVFVNTRFYGDRFQENEARDSGAAIWVAGRAQSLVFSSVFDGNTGETNSAVSVDRNASLFAFHSTFAHNEGAAAFGVGAGAQAKLVNSILWDNRNAADQAGADIFVLTRAQLRRQLGDSYREPDAAVIFAAVGRLEINNSIVQSLASLSEGDDYLAPTVFGDGVTASEQTIQAVAKNMAAAEAGSLHEAYRVYNVGEGIRPGVKTRFRNSADDPLIGTGYAPTVGSPAFYFGDKARVDNGGLLNYSLTQQDFERVKLVDSQGRTAAGAVQTPRLLSRYYVVPGGAGSGDGSSWANASGDLKATMALPGVEVWVKEGTYHPSTNDPLASFSLGLNSTLYGGFAGNETELSARDVAARPTILSGALPGGGNSYHVIVNTDLTGTSVLDGFTITGGRATSALGIDRNGGGMRNKNATPLLRNCRFIDNQAAERGGAIYAYIEGGTRDGPVLENCHFENNRAADGGAVYYGTQASVSRCVFKNNTATGLGGAAVLMGINDEIDTPHPSGLRDSLFAGNAASGNYGGAIYGQTRLVVIGSTLANNTLTRATARTAGGAGLYNFGNVHLDNTLLWGNRLAGAVGSVSVERQQADVAYPSTLYADHSDIEALDVYRGRSSQANLDYEPFFKNPASGDYSLAEWSPLIDAGLKPTGYTDSGTDILNVSRPQGDAPDIGAYEFDSSKDPRLVDILISRDCGASLHYTLKPDLPDLTPVLQPQWSVDRRDGRGFVSLSNDSQHLGVTNRDLILFSPGPAQSGWIYRLTSQGGYHGSTALPALGRSRLYVKAGGAGLKNGTSWANAFATIEAALAAATVVSDPCVQIWVAAGTYQPGNAVSSTWSLRSGIALLGGFAGTETSASDRDPGAHPTVLSAEIGSASLTTDNIAVLFTNTDTDRSAQIDGFVLRGAARTAVSNSDASPVIRDCVFEQNAGAVQNSRGSEPWIVLSTFRNNLVHDGVIRDVDSASDIQSCTFHDNTGTFATVIRSVRSQTDVHFCTFWNNQASTETGGISSEDNSVVTVVRCIFWNNLVSRGAATAEQAQLRARGGGLFAVSNSVIQGLSAYAANGNVGYDPLLVDPWNGDFALSSRSPAIPLGAGVGNTPASGNPLRLLESPRNLATCGLGGAVDFTVRWKADEPFAPAWEIEVGGVFTPLASSGYVSSLIDAAGSQTLRLTLPAGADLRIRVRDTLSSYVGAAFPVRLPPPSVLRVRAGANPAVADGLSWNTAFATVEAAVAAADSCTEIWIRDGVWLLPAEGLQIERKIALYGGFDGDEDTRAERHGGVTELRGVVDIDYADSGSIFDGLTFTGTDPDEPAVWVAQSQAIFAGCVFTHPSATGFYTPGVYVHSGAVSFESCAFTGNANSGAQVGDGFAAFSDCDFVSNAAKGASGAGALTVLDGARVEVDGCRFVDNSTVDEGGAIFSNGHLTVTNSVFSRNRAARHGGAVVSYSELVFVNNTVFGGYSRFGGGGLAVIDGTAEVANSVFWDNTDGNGYQRTAASSLVESAQIYVRSSLPLSVATVTRSIVQGLQDFAGNGNLASHPVFNDPEQGDFGLSPNSPAIDLGLPAPLAGAGAARSVSGAAPDAGALEFGGTQLSTLLLTRVPSSVHTCSGRPAVYVVEGAEVIWERSASRTSGFVQVANDGIHVTSFADGVSTLTLPSPNKETDDETWFRFAIPAVGYVSPAYRLDVAPPAVLRVKAGSGAVAPDGLSWATAFPTLEAAVALADTCDEIWVAAGTYTPATPIRPKAGVEIYGGFNGTTDSARADRDPVGRPTILRGAPAFASDPEDQADGTTLVDGFIVRSTGADTYALSFASPTGARFRDCRFEGGAGGSALYANNSSPRFDLCSFSGFSGRSLASLRSSAAEFAGCTFEQNAGTLLALDGGSAVSVTDALVRQNTAWTDFYSLMDVDGESTLTLLRGRFSANTEVSGLRVTTGSTATVFGASFVANTGATGRNHAILLNGGAVRLAHVTIYGNTSTDASGLWGAFETYGGSAEAVNSIFWGNRGASPLDTLETQQIGVRASTALSFTSCIVEGLDTFAGSGNTGFDPFLADPLSGDDTPQAWSPATGSAAALPDWAQQFASAGSGSVGAGQFTGTSQPPVQVMRRPGNVTVYERNPATFFADVVAGTEAGVIWEYTTDGVTWLDATLTPGTTVSTTAGRSTLTVRSAVYGGPVTAGYRYRVPSASFTSSLIKLIVLPRRVVYVKATASGNNDGSSWTHAYARLDEALEHADSSMELRVAQGAYEFPRTLLPVGVEIHGGFRGTEATATPEAHVPSFETVIRGPLAAVSFPEDALWPDTLIERVTFAGNSTTEAAVLVFAAGLTLQEVVFENQAARALQIRAGSEVIVSGAVFTGNSAGSVLVDNSDVAFTACAFSDNAGFAFQDVSVTSSTALFTDCSFTGALRGVALSANGSELRIERSIFRHNLGGGINAGGSAGQLTASNVLFDRNGGSGFVLYAGSASLAHATFAGNQRRNLGAGVLVRGGALTLANSILWGNRATDMAAELEEQQIEVTSGTATLSHVAVEGLRALTGTDLQGWDPLFVNASAGNLRLQTISPALDAGAVIALATDLDGNARTFGSASDLGAYELAAPAAAAALRIRTVPVSAAVCSGGSVQFSVDTDGSGAAVRWHSSLTADLDGSVASVPNTVFATADLSTVTINPVPVLANDLQVWFSVDGTSYVSPRVTLSTTAVKPIRVRAGAPAGGDGLSWATAFQTIEAAVAVADDCSEIWVANGTYSPAATIALRPGLRIRGGFAGTETYSYQRREIGEGTLVNTPASGGYALFSAGGTVDRTTWIEGLVIVGDSGVAAFRIGGGSPRVSDCVLQDHTGFAAVQVNPGNPLFERVIFRDNGFFSIFVTAGSVEVRGCTFEDNFLPPDSSGGSALALGGPTASAIVADSTFTGNADLAIGTDSAGATLTVLRSRFLDNEDGAIQANGPTGVRHSLFARNTAPDGGAIYLGSSGTLELVNATVVGNLSTAFGGGALHLYGATTVRNSLFWQNRDRATGRSIEEQQVRVESGGSLAIDHSLVEGLAVHAGNGNFDYDPLFDPAGLADYYRLGRFSPAVEAGSAASFGADDTADLSGKARVSGDAPDVGASEVADLRGRQPLYFTSALESGLSPICAGSGTTLSVHGAPATMAAVQWQMWNGSLWQTLSSGGGITLATSGSTASLTVAASASYVTDRYIRMAVAGTTYVSDYRRISQWDHPILHVDASAPAGGDGLSWNTAFRTVGEALAVAADCNEIWIAAGTYDVGFTLTVPGSVSIRGGFAGHESRASQADPATNVVTLLSASDYTLLDFAGDVTPDTVIEGLTLSGSSRAAEIQGASPTFRRVTFTGQTQFSARITQAGAQPHFEACVFVGAGSTISVHDAAAVPASLGAVISDSTFTAAGIQATRAALLEVRDCSFSDTELSFTLVDDALVSGALLERSRIETALGGTLRVQASEIWDNVQLAGSGGGLRVGSGVTATVVGTLFRANHASSGGAVQIDSGGALTLRSSILRDNVADNDGGGVRLVTGGAFTAVNCTVYGNTAAGFGGGLCTFGDPATLRNCIFWGNTAGIAASNTLERAQLFFSPTPPANLVVTHSVVEGLDALAGNGNTGLDPLLVTVEREFLALDSYSPAIDLGDDAHVVTGETDIRGNDRVRLARVDAGAAEAGFAAPESLHENTPRIYGNATEGRHFATSFVYPEDLELRLGTLAWAWQIDTGSGWRDLVNGVDGVITFGAGSTDLLLLLVSGSLDGARLRVVARHDGTLAYVSEAGSLEVLPGRVARVLPGSAGGDGGSWDTAYASLATALAAAAEGDITEIWVAAGTYPGAVDLIPGVSLYGGFAGTETFRNQRDPAAHPAFLQNSGGYVISADGQLVPLGAETVVDGFTVAGGAHGVQVAAAFPVFRNLTITGNTGHGVYTLGTVVDDEPTSQPLFEDCSIVGNTGVFGAGVYLAGGGLLLERCTINGNDATTNGGGIYVVNGLVMARNSVVAGNRSGGAGGGLYLSQGEVVLANLTIASNQAGGTDGGGLFVHSAELELYNSILWGNRAATGTTVEKQQFDRQNTGIFLSIRHCALEGLVTYINNGNVSSDPYFAFDPGATAAPFAVADLALPACSLLVDAGNNGYTNLADTDLDGRARRYADGIVDIGAHEAQSVRIAPIVIAGQPTASAACPGSDAVLTVTASGDGLSYEWEFDTLDGQGFLPVVDDAQHDNVAGSSLTVHLQSIDQHGWKYRARVTGGGGCRVVSSTAILQVSANRLYVNGAAPAGGNGRTWATAYRTLTSALADSLLTTCGTGEIWMAAGTYSTTADQGYAPKANVTILGGFPAGGTLLTRNPATNETILTGTGRWVVLNSAAVPGAIVDGVTITGGTTNSVYMLGAANPTFRNVRVGRPTTTTGASIRIEGTAAPVFDGLSVTGTAVYNFVSTAAGTTATVSRLVFNGVSANHVCVGAGNLNFANVLVTGNTFSSGCIQSTGAGIAEIRHATFAGNYSAGALLYGGGVFRLYNSIVWSNRIDPFYSYFIDSPTGAVRYSDVQGSLNPATVTESRSNVDPQFVSPVAATSTTPNAAGNFALSACSPLISSGLNAYSGTTTVDVLGQPRPFDAVADLGAYEYQSPAVAIETQPAAASASWGGTASFTAGTTLATTWQWQRSRATINGGAYANLADDADYAGTATGTLTLLRPVPAAGGDLYRVIVSDGSCRTITSASAAFTYLAANLSGIATGAGGERIARSGDTLTATLGGDFVPGSVLASAVGIHGLQTGRHAPAALAATGAGLSLAPGGDFSAGERVWISLTDRLQQTGVGGIRSSVLGYRAAVAAVPGAPYAGTPVSWSTSGAAGAMVPGDFTGDGANDLVVSTPSGLALFANNGAGDFADPVALGGSPAAQLLAADLDDDGDLDLLAVGSDGTVSRWFNAAGALAASGPSFGSSVRAAALGDLDGDGDLDLYVARDGGDQVWLNTAGVFASSGQTLGTASGRAVALGDFDRDGALDALVAYAATNAQLWTNNGRAVFTAGAAPASGPATAVAGGDLNGDGFLDAAFSHSDRAATIWLGNGAGALTATGTMGRLGMSYYQTPTSGHDFNNLPARLIDNDTATYFHNTGTGTIQLGFNVSNEAPVKEVLVTAANVSSGGNYLRYSFRVYGVRADSTAVQLGYFSSLNSGSPTIIPSVTTPGGSVTLSLPANTEIFPRIRVDVTPLSTNDHWMAELAIRALLGGNAGSSASGLDLADFDGDGDLDLWLRSADNTARAYLNDGAGAFTASAAPALASGAAFALADFSGFGAVDLAHAPASGEGVELRRYRAIDLTLSEGTTHPFAAAEFTSRLAIGNQASAVAFRIVALPASATLTLGGTPVTAGQIVAVSSLGQLVLAPEPGFHGLDSFAWEALDAADAALESFTTHIQVTYDPRLPRISAQPASQGYSPHAPLTLAVTATGAGPLSYAWFHDGDLLPAETAATLTIPAGRPEAVGTYVVVVSNAFGSATSDPMAVALSGRPYFTLVPSGSTIRSGQNVQFSVAAVGPGPIAYAWYRGALGDRSHLLAPNSLTFLTPALTATTTFWVEATNAAGSASLAATVVVDGTLPVIGGLPAPISTSTAPGLLTAVVSWTPPTANDNVALASLVSNHAPGEAFPVGVTTVTYTATDSSGNVATASFTVTVTDTSSPIAAADTVTRPPGQVLKIAIAGLLANDSSPTGAAFSFDGAAAASAQGVTITRSGAFLVYAAPAELSADDTFTYSIRDAAGLTATGTVTVHVAEPEATETETTVSIEARVGGGFVLRLLGVPGREYTLQRCDNLGAPTPVWTDFATGQADAQGRYTIEDPEPLAAGSRFYRAVCNR